MQQTISPALFWHVLPTLAKDAEIPRPCWQGKEVTKRKFGRYPATEMAAVCPARSKMEVLWYAKWLRPAAEVDELSEKQMRLLERFRAGQTKPETVP